MAISPVVSQYQEKIMQRQEDLSPEHASFNKKFGDAAYDSLTGRYPKLLARVITFKVVESDPEQGTGVGAFIIRSGDAVRYIPVVLAEGSISSCEMVYDKDADTLMPLNQGSVQRILASRGMDSAELVKNPRVENTRQMFRDMFRPPSSSMPVIAGADQFTALPDAAKKAISDYLLSHPGLLQKVAAFYPVEALAAKLARGTEKVAEEAAEDASVTVIRLDELTKQAASALTREEKDEVLRRGYLLKTAAEDKARVLSTVELPNEATRELELIEVDGKARLYGCGFLLRLTGTEIATEPCIMSGRGLYTGKGCVSRLDHSRVVMSHFTDGITAEALKALGAVAPEDVSLPKGSDDNDERVASYEDKQLVCFYPTKAGTYKAFSAQEAEPSNESVLTVSYDDTLYVHCTEKRNIDGVVFLSAEYGNASIGFVDNLKNGYVRVGDGEYILPKDSLVLAVGRDKTAYLQSLSSAHRLFRAIGVRLKIDSDHAGGLMLRDFGSGKTAFCRDEANLAEHLATAYGLGKTAVDKVIGLRDAIVFSKEAFVQASPIERADSTEEHVNLPYTTGHAAAQQNPYMAPEVNGELLDTAAAFGDQDTFDTGMLAAISGDDDIKTLLLDMLPRFVDTTTDIGKTLLIFLINSVEIEEYYGMEEYAGLVNNLRKMFRMLGDLVQDLQRYVNMH